MNVIISTLRQNEIANLDIEVIKSIHGVFEADELVQMFSNFFFGRMILDLTALKDYKDVRNLQKFAMSLDVEKIIVLLPDDAECLAPGFLSKLISMGIYNFTTNMDGVAYLLNNPNTYRDVAHLHQIDNPTPVIKTVVSNSNNTSNNTVSDVESKMVDEFVASGPYILGIKNITEHSGSTMLVYMLMQHIKNIGKKCIALEITKRDFVFFNNKDMISTDKDNFSREIANHSDCNVIVVDLNRDGDESLCNEVLYLLEPSTIKLNKLMLSNRRIFEKLAGRKIIINQNIMGDSDVKQLEREANFKTFFVLPPLDERGNNREILEELLSKVGIIDY